MPANISARSSELLVRLIYNNIVGDCSTGMADRRVRSTYGLSEHQANGVIEAALHARHIGLPFNRHVTIRLERAGIPDSEAMKAIGAFLTRVRDWLRKQGHRTAFAWVRENGSVIGSHVHILLHIPDGVSLGHRPRRWIAAVSGRSYRRGTIKTKRISKAAYEENLWVLVGYLCKGALPNVAQSLGLGRRQPGGTVIGKRAGWSENVGLKARSTWGRGRGAGDPMSTIMVPF